MATPRTSESPPQSEVREPDEGLSIQTLIIAALSSAIAAVVISNVWERGTIIASAMTPVVVAIVADLLKKPVQSERLRSSVRNVSTTSRPRSGRTPKAMAPPESSDGAPRPDAGEPAGPVRVYSSGSHRRLRVTPGTPRRKLHLKIAVITGLVGFVIAAAALTLPELLFDGSVGGGDRNTTLFGGGESSDSGESQDGGTNDGRPDAPTQQEDPDAPVAPGGEGDGSGDDETAPDSESTPPTPTTPPEAPTEPAPQSP